MSTSTTPQFPHKISAHTPRTVWITGASRGIGRALAVQLAHEPGTTLIVSARSTESLRSLHEELSGTTAVHVFACDVSSADAIAETHSRIAERTGGVDVLVNNAGVLAFVPLVETALDVFDEIMNVNVRGAFLCIQAVLPRMIERGTGTIVNINSVAATKVFSNSAVYSASKAALLAMSRSLREEVRKQGIKIIDILPGATETAMWDAASREQFRHAMMQPEDVAEAIAAMLSLPSRMMPEELSLRPQFGDL